MGSHIFLKIVVDLFSTKLRVFRVNGIIIILIENESKNLLEFITINAYKSNNCAPAFSFIPSINLAMAFNCSYEDATLLWTLT